MIVRRLHGDSREEHPSAIAGVLEQLERFGTGEAKHVRHFPARAARTTAWPDHIDPVVRAALEGQGVAQLWQHQADALDAIARGEHVVVATGTASGKSLAYQVPMLSTALQPEGLSGLAAVRGPTTLYLAPTKALAADQRSRLEALAIPGVRVATLDGDTPLDERRWIRDHASVILSNPDLLHHALLPAHERWSTFWRSLRMVVIDECHVYRGVFGAHTAGVIRRLRRVAARYGSEPTFVLASATSGEPGEHARQLTGLDVRAITEDASPHPSVTFTLWQPGPPPGADEDEPRRSAVAETGDLLTGLVENDVQTLAFARSRVGVEVVADMARQRLENDGFDSTRVAAYRGGYLPEERRELERALREHRLTGLATTSALELGIDVSGLDAVVLAGWPGTVASLHQQTGRAGRSGRDALAVFVAADDPLDTYLVNNPDAFFDRSIEATVVDPENPYVLAPQLACAAAELPITEADEAYFGPTIFDLLPTLEERKILRRRPRGWFWAREDRPGDHVSLRGADEQEVRIVEARTGRVLGTVDGARSHSAVHTGAVYVHQGRTYLVRELDLADGSAHVVAGNPGWATWAREQSSFDILASERSTTWGSVRLNFGTIRVRSQVTSFLRQLPSGEVIGEHPLELPERSLTTKGVWWTIPEQDLRDADIDEETAPGSLHAAEHCSIGLIGLVAQGDRWDIGGVSTALHPDTGLPTVVVYDAQPGGSGFAERAYERAATWLTASLEAIRTCQCSHGCPSCIQSPKCGNGNNPLDKAGSIRLLEAVLRDAFDPGKPAISAPYGTSSAGVDQPEDSQRTRVEHSDGPALA